MRLQYKYGAASRALGRLSSSDILDGEPLSCWTVNNPMGVDEISESSPLTYDCRTWVGRIMPTSVIPYVSKKVYGRRRHASQVYLNQH